MFRMFTDLGTSCSRVWVSSTETSDTPLNLAPDSKTELNIGTSGIESGFWVVFYTVIRLLVTNEWLRHTPTPILWRPQKVDEGR